jgi:hypothetical protein
MQDTHYDTSTMASLISDQHERVAACVHAIFIGDPFKLEWSHAQIFSFMRRFFLIKYYEMICIYFLRKESTSYASGQTTSHY